MVGRLIAVVITSFIWGLCEWGLIGRIDFPLLPERKKHKELATKNEQHVRRTYGIVCRCFTIIYGLISTATVVILCILSNEITFLIGFVATFMIHGLYFGILVLMEHKY